MTRINAAGPAPGSDAAAARPEDTGPLARDFQDLLLADGNGGRATVTITLAQGGDTASHARSGFEAPIVITAVNGGGHPSEAFDGPEAGLAPERRAPGEGGGEIVITVVHGNGHPDALDMRTITAVTGGDGPRREPALRVITAVHGNGHPTALPEKAGPRVVTITAVNRSG